MDRPLSGIGENELGAWGIHVIGEQRKPILKLLERAHKLRVLVVWIQSLCSVFY